MKAMILAAGFGTRLKPFTDHHPKALALAGGKTLLEHAIRYLQRHGIYEVVVNVHHFADQIEETVCREKGFGSKVFISDERTAILDTGGGVLQAAPSLQHDPYFVVMNVDILTTLNLEKLIQQHEQNCAMATLAVMERTSSRYLLCNAEGQLCGWENRSTGEKKIARHTQERLVAKAFSGIQVISREIFSQAFPSSKLSLITMYLQLAATYPIYTFDHTGDTFIDAGKPADLARADLLLG